MLKKALAIVTAAIMMTPAVPAPMTTLDAMDMQFNIDCNVLGLNYNICNYISPLPRVR